MLAGLLSGLPSSMSSASGETTFYRDVLPILQRHCQSCHRAGEIGPMPLITYEQTRPWAKAIRKAVSLRTMPPWFADPHFGEFANNPSLTAAEIATVQAWVDGAAPAGSPAVKPLPPADVTLNADVVTRMPVAFPVPAHSTIGYQYFVLSPGFKTDTWVRTVQIRPSDRSVVHHAVLYVRAPGETLTNTAPIKSDILAIYTPGAPVMTCPEGMAKKIPAGSDLVLQMHYTSKATDAKDQTEIRMVTSSERPRLRLLTLQMSNYNIRILPGERDQRFRVSGTLPQEALLVSLYPHMHLRGSGFEFQIVRGQGRVDTLLKVDSYNFYWQLSYWLKTPLKLEAGTRLVWTGYFDNSAGNPRNPDPEAEVTWGEQSWEEMMVGFFDVAISPELDKKDFFIR